MSLPSRSDVHVARRGERRRSRDSRAPRSRPSAMWMTMKPPPPMLPASGYTTASANSVATAASTALPPRCRISLPTRARDRRVAHDHRVSRDERRAAGREPPAAREVRPARDRAARRSPCASRSAARVPASVAPRGVCARAGATRRSRERATSASRRIIVNCQASGSRCAAQPPSPKRATRRVTEMRDARVVARRESRSSGAARWRDPARRRAGSCARTSSRGRSRTRR